MAEKKLSVDVVYAQAGRVSHRTVELAVGSTVREAIEAAGMLEALPGGLFDAAQLGIFSRKVSADHLVQEGDRIEIYRPLLIDPMEARRRRAH